MNNEKTEDVPTFHVTESAAFQVRQEALEMAHTHMTANAADPDAVPIRSITDTAVEYYHYLIGGVPRGFLISDEDEGKMTADIRDVKDQ